MMFDSVREELKDKVSVLPRSVRKEPQSYAQPIARPAAVSAPDPMAATGGDQTVCNQTVTPFVPAAPEKPAAAHSAPVPEPARDPSPRIDTAQITAKPTSPTLVEFQPKNAALPDWKLQIQNAVRKRRENSVVTESQPVPTIQSAAPRSAAAAARAVAVRTEPSAAQPAAQPEDEKLAKVLRRIEESRRRYLDEETAAPTRAPEPPAQPAQAPQAKPYQLYMATRNRETLPKPPEPRTAPPTMGYTPASIIEDLPIISKRDLDTNKLRPLPNSSVISTGIERAGIHDTNAPSIDAPVISISRAMDDVSTGPEVEAYSETAVEALEIEEYDDLAPLSLRISAAAFDIVIGSVVSMILMSPFVLSRGSWLTLAGAIAFGVTFAIVMFIYLTTAVGFYGQTLGMRIFSLEVIDIEDEEYPTLHQAAVNAVVYLASLILGGIGFLPALFNEEKRAAHDLLAGTVVVREEC